MDETVSKQRFEELFTEMFSESDRGCILIGASVLDDLLASLLQNYLKRNEHVCKQAMEPLFSGMGPLASFSSRIKLTYCLGLIKKWEFEDLERIRKIRNKAAHEFTPKTFTNKEIIQITQRLEGANHSVAAMEKFAGKIEKSKGEATGNAGPSISKERLRFQMTVIHLAAGFDLLSKTPHDVLIHLPLDRKMNATLRTPLKAAN